MLSLLPKRELARLQPQLQRVHLDLKQVLYESDGPIESVYFPIDAIVSLLTVLRDGTAIETRMTGHEGIVGLPLFLGAHVSDSRATCQQAGDAWSLSARAFRAVLRTGGKLPVLLLRQSQSTIRRVGQTAACNAMHSLDQRSARWLLTMRDLVETDTFVMTQLFLSQMLGVRRASVVDVMTRLRDAGLISHHYGKITILDLPGLEAVACECFGVLKAADARAAAA